MGVRFIIESLAIRTASASATYNFASGVTAVTGPLGSGKSSMLELIKFALGGRAKVMPAVRDNVQVVILTLRIGNQRLELSRSLTSRLIDIVDKNTNQRLNSWATTNRRNVPRAGQELLSAIGFPRDLRVPQARKRPSGKTIPVSFFDVYRYLYLEQNNIDRSVVGHDDRDLNVKRLAVFELLYKLTNPRILEVASERTKFVQLSEKNKSAARNVADFLAVSNELDPQLIEAERARAEESRRVAYERLDGLREGSVAPTAGSGPELELARLRKRISALETEKDIIEKNLAKDQSVLAQLALDEQVIAREEAASTTLSGLEFTRCPRCLQSIRERDVDAGCCILCVQPQPVQPGSKAAIELKRIADQRKETQELLDEDRTYLDSINRDISQAQRELTSVFERARDRSRQPGDPLFDEVVDVSRMAAEADARVERLAAAQARWAYYRELLQVADEADEQVRQLEAEERDLRLDQEEGFQRLNDLSETFNEILGSLRDPWYREAHIDKEDYLPVVDGEHFDMLSVGGARKTLVNLAYHLANLSMAISHRSEVLMPPLLIVDSPRKNVGEGGLDRDVVEAIYRRLRTLQDASGDAFQLIIVDNQLPSSARLWIQQEVSLTYDQPFVPGVLHPGEGVETLDSGVAVELG
ncbi:AAA family ATPase [Nonomuraea sp. ATR24]|uniref:AAA family ATPase n=1 Tax=Nonomuraea sp. ATR24 TaxID=1676744 RepID=UPI0035C05711